MKTLLGFLAAFGCGIEAYKRISHFDVFSATCFAIIALATLTAVQMMRKSLYR